MNKSLYWEALNKVVQLTENNTYCRNTTAEKTTVIIESYSGYLSKEETQQLYTVLNSYILREKSSY